MYQNLNFAHAEMNFYVLRVLNSLVLVNNKHFNERLLEAMEAFQINYKFKHRFQPLFMILSKSSNLVLVKQLLQFAVNLAKVDKGGQAELQRLLMGERLFQVQKGLREGRYKLEHCGFKCVQDALHLWKEKKGSFLN